MFFKEELILLLIRRDESQEGEWSPGLALEKKGRGLEKEREGREREEKDKEKAAVCKPGREPSLEPDHADILISDFQAPEQ